jgi:hypothetical protein
MIRGNLASNLVDGNPDPRLSKNDSNMRPARRRDILEIWNHLDRFCGCMSSTAGELERICYLSVVNEEKDQFVYDGCRE